MSFSKKPDVMSLTMALVEAFARGDEAAIDVARNKLVSIETRDIFHSLYKFGQVLNRANIDLERTAAVIESELNVEGKTSEMTAAIIHVGRAILLVRTQAAVFEALSTYGAPLQDSTSDQLRQLALVLAGITGSVCRQLNVTFHWA
jgi:hypothetical protein